MFGWLKTQKNQRRVAVKLYANIVEQARNPDFYRQLGVADTLEGRYEMVVAHLVLVIERLRAEGSSHKELARTLVETFVADMDDSMRELGVGDTSVPKKVKSAAAGLVERTASYRAALAADTDQLAATLRAHLLDQEVGAKSAPPTESDRTIAKYMRESAGLLAEQPIDQILSQKALFAPLEISKHH